MTLITSIFSVVWVYLYIQSPFLLFCFYPTMKRFDGLFRPVFVVPVVVAASLFYFEETLASPPTYSFHFLIAGSFIVSSYMVCMRSGFQRTEAFILSVLTMIAVDELWQMPYNIVLWTKSLEGFAIGIATGGWNLMSIPFIAYFLIKFRGHLFLARSIKSLLIGLISVEVLFAILLELSSQTWPYNDELYLMVFPWFLFFLVLFRTSATNPASLVWACSSMETCILDRLLALPCPLLAEPTCGRTADNGIRPPLS